MKDEIKEILEDYKKLAGEITEKLDNTAEYESWLIVQDYFDKLLDCITNLQEKLKMVERDNKIYKLRHNNAIKKLSSAINHYNLEGKNNTILFVKEILEGNDISEKSYRKLNGGE